MSPPAAPPVSSQASEQVFDVSGRNLRVMAQFQGGQPGLGMEL